VFTLSIFVDFGLQIVQYVNSNYLTKAMNDLELTNEQIQQELDGLIDNNDNIRTPPKEPKTKKLFVPKSKEEIDKLSRREQFEYKIELSKSRTEELRNEYQDYKRRETKTDRSRENKRLIIMGRFLDTQLHKRPDRKVQYMVVAGHLDQYLTKDNDRQLLGFPPLEQSGKANLDRN
jgi:hypothetical protein